MSVIGRRNWLYDDFMERGLLRRHCYGAKAAAELAGTQYEYG